jgi:putative ABC transport system permease protein
VLLLVGAGLLLRTLSSLARVNLGFQSAETLTMGLFLGLRPPETRSAIIDQILERVEGVPGVKAAGTIQFLPLRGMTCGTGFWLEEHAAGRDPSRTLPTQCALVSRGYFAAMGIPVLEGRPADRRDRMASPRVLVVNQSFAKRYFADGRVLGRHILVHGSNQALAEIIGVVGDVRHAALTSDPAPTVFLLHGVDEPDVCESLREIAKRGAAAWISFLGEQAHVVCTLEKALELTNRFDLPKHLVFWP